eukprot:CAMPEP_0196573712 /NCGR_PEP_ID=MMETSP1081-20130531/3569_1 /TAXON_ID=36882 /ORGANISM="Pyramimonas amylifera, Strain CCMP720" /LENGTH=140 /DNA_ID=CAMNT_0041891529 /DNA_START=678 /DNA_END=1100 /DNA_ORIENTATION=+
MSNIVKRAGVAGPVFISIGDAPGLQKFLELNPNIPKEFAFVDDTPDLDAYTAAGFASIGSAFPDMDNMKMPDLGGQWMDYAASVMAISPVDVARPSLSKVLRLGGTFVIGDDKVLYAWADTVPGDHPDVKSVLKAIGINQ